MPRWRAPAASTTTPSRCAWSPRSKRNMRASTGSTSPGRRSKAWSSITGRSPGLSARGKPRQPVPESILDLLRASRISSLPPLPRSRRKPPRLPTTSPTTITTSTTASAPGCSVSPSSPRCRSPRSALGEVRAAYPGIDGTRLLYESIRRLITAMIEDAVAESERRLATLAPRSAGDVRHAHARHGRLLRRRCGASSIGLRAFLSTRVYRHPRIARIMGEARQAWCAICSRRYSDDPEALPPEWRDAGAAARHARPMPATSADFIAGMTDRYRARRASPLV